MPITRTHPTYHHIDSKDESETREIAEECICYLQKFPNYAFTATELAARIETAAPEIVIEDSLSTYGVRVEWQLLDGTLYWHIEQ